MIPVNPGNARFWYDVCPLCRSESIHHLRYGDAVRHALYHEELGDKIPWSVCENCGHVFTSGFFTGDAKKILFSSALATQRPGDRVEAKRYVSGEIVSRISDIRKSSEGSWLDVGFGDGSLLTTADEFGYSVSGVDVRKSVVGMMKGFGLTDVSAVDFLSYEPDRKYDVISMADVLEHMAFPRDGLRHAGWLLADLGLLFISCPNMGSFLWKRLDTEGANPYWNELEHYHNFSRKRLYQLLKEVGFEVLRYDVSKRYRVCMEVVAQWVGGSDTRDV